jgi:hypothetical protein
MSNLKADNIYYNFNITNDPTTSDTDTLLASREINFDQILLENPQDFYVSIQRFSVNGKAIPILICPILEGQPNKNLTPWTISLKNPVTNLFVTQSIIYVPDNDVNPNFVNPPIPRQDLNYKNGLYYYIFTYQVIADLFNTAFTTAMIQLKILDATIPANYVAPYIIFNEITGRFNMIVDYRNTVDIYFNTIGSLMFDGIRIFYAQSQPADFVNKVVVEIFPNNENEHFVNGVATSPRTILLDQEYQNIDYINSCKSIIFISNTLGSQKEFITTRGIESGALSGISILTDFEFPFDTLGGPRQKLQYSTTGISNLRLVNINNINPIKKLDVSIFWQDYLGRVFPLYLYTNTNVSIKFVFVRKTLFKNLS